MRYFSITILATILSIALLITTPVKSKTDPKSNNNKESVIIEVEGDPHKHKAYLEAYHPFIEVIAVYDKLFNGMALQADPKKLAKMSRMDFIKAVHTVQTYEANAPEQTKQFPTLDALQDAFPNTLLPSELNRTKYTGKGVKVAVIDTGIAYDHPDLKMNYKGGYDLVDLDDDPMETLDTEGIPTLHGSHVAGIIAADGSLKGVAPDADLYAYRALGPGGVGSSIQVIAAMEQAVKDKVDIINLSLGNIINGPDFPTSIAVNRAIELGVSVIIANGNNGPDNWTVGAPATAAKALAVGAASNTQLHPFLHEKAEGKTIAFTSMIGSVPWQLEKDYEVVNVSNPRGQVKLNGKIALVKRGKIPFYELAKNAQEKGAVAALIYNNKEGGFQGSIDNGEGSITIPVASITKREGERLLRRLSEEKPLYMDTIYKEIKSGVAAFSSRGPVTVTWDIKPDILAPGTNIISTVPGGYLALQGTSMAAPHVAGAIALMKEAHPDWSTEQLFGALKTTAIQMNNDEGLPLAPVIQGTGQIRPREAIETSTIIYNPSLPFGKISGYNKTKKIDVTIENTTNEPQRYSFDIPKRQKGISWKLPQSFILKKKERKTIPIEVSITPSLLDKGIHQGWVTLNQYKNTYHLPYLFVNETADYPKAMGFEFSLKPYSKDEYVYRLYVTDQVKHVDVELYNPDTLVYARSLIRLDDDIQIGMNEGYIKKSDIGRTGLYKALITVQLENGKYESYETELYIDP